VGEPFPVDRPVDEAVPSRRLATWRAASARVVCSEPVVERVLRRSQVDLGSLRIVDPARPGVEVVAAGAPWFMAAFGRDSLLSSWMALPFDPSLALGTLQTLAALQGRRVDVMSEEEPGRILHEVRRGVDESRALGGSRVYYGSVDATPLFVMLLDEVARWGAPWEKVAELLPAADAALAWVEEFGDRDGDGFVEYQRTTDRGLVNQGWKDSGDSISFADGRGAIAPIALCEVQGYVYGAYLARAHLAELDQDPLTASRCRERAGELRRRFDEAFWLSEQGYYAIALDRDKAPVDALASNMGHCLWTGIVRGERAGQVVERLLGPELFSGWGIRTLATSMARFNPVSYHNGSVWPHDNALVVAGLMRYGFTEAAQRVATGIMSTAATFGGRLPELFCGFDRRDVPVPVAYPSSCSPQAWAAATPLSLLRTLLRLDTCLPHRQVVADPVLPASWGHLHVTGLPLGPTRITLDTTDPAVATTPLPEDVRYSDDPWPVHTSDRIG
jgi:glycogen debranching enzyme